MVAGDISVALVDKYIDPSRSASRILARLAVQVVVQCIDTRAEFRPVVRGGQGFQFETTRRLRGHLFRAAPREPPCRRHQPGAWWRWINEHFRERLRITFTQLDDTAIQDHSPRRALSTGHYEVAQAAALQACRSLQQPLLICGDPRLEPL